MCRKIEEMIKCQIVQSLLGTTALPFVVVAKVSGCLQVSFLYRNHDYVDAQKSFLRSRPTSDDEENAKMSTVSASASLSALLIPSLKEVGSGQVILSLQVPST